MASFLPTHCLDTDMDTIPEFVYPRDEFIYRKKRYKVAKKRFVERDNAYCFTTDKGALWLRPNEAVSVL